MFRLISLIIRMSEGINLLSELLVKTDKLIRSSQVEADSLHAKSSIIPFAPPSHHVLNSRPAGDLH